MWVQILCWKMLIPGKFMRNRLKKSASLTSPNGRQRTAGCMSQPSLTALISPSSVWPWMTAWGRSCVRTLDSAAASYPALRGAVVHSDRGSQYTSGAYRAALEKHGIRQSMNSDGGRCHDNARCESMWARMKCELFYDRIAPENMTDEQLKTLIWRYFISYWNRRINFPGISVFQHNICIHIYYCAYRYYAGNFCIQEDLSTFLCDSGYLSNNAYTYYSAKPDFK